MVEFNVAKTTDDPNRVRAGATINSTVLITNDSPHFANEYNRQNSMAPWVQRVPSVQVGVNQQNVVGARFFNAGAIASLAGVLAEAGSVLRLRDFEFSDLAGGNAAIAFVARVYQGTNNFGTLLTTEPGSNLTGDGVAVPVPGTQFYIELEALQPNVFMNRARVGEATLDVLPTISETIPVAPAGITRTWEAMHSVDNALLPATSGTGDISWSNIVLPAGEAIAISIHDTIPVTETGDYVNAASIVGNPGDTGTWVATGQTVEVLPPLQDLVDCAGAWNIQDRQAVLKAVLKNLVSPAYAVFKLYNTATNTLIWQSDPIPGSGAANQPAQTVVPLSSGVLQPGQQYEFEIECFDPNLELISSSERCFERCAPFTTLTDAEYSYLNCDGSWYAFPSRHAIMPRNAIPELKNPDEINPMLVGPAVGAYAVTYEFWNGSTWVDATVKAGGSANTYGAPAPLANPELADIDTLPGSFSFTGLLGDGQSYPWRMTLRNAQNEIIDQVQCAQLRTATVPPLQCPTAVTNITDNGATLTYGPIDRNQYAFAERDNITIQARAVGTNNWFTAGNTLLPDGDNTARLLDSVQVALAGLTPGTQYDIRVVYATDPGFPARGYTSAACQAILQTTGTAPITEDADCDPATTITLTGATLRGTVSADPGHSYYFEYSESSSGPWAQAAPPVAVSGSNVAVSQAVTGLDQATEYFYRLVLIDTTTNAVVSTSSNCRFQTNAPNAIIATEADGDCPPNGTEEGEPPLTITVTHEFRHQGGTDPITGDVSIDANPAPTGTTITAWSAVIVGGVTGSALGGTGPVDETITLQPGASITYTLTYDVPGPSGGAFQSRGIFDGPGTFQNWVSTLNCTVDEQRLDCEPAFLDLANLPRQGMRQFSYDGVTYAVYLDENWTVAQLVTQLNVVTPNKFAADGDRLLTPGTRWSQGTAVFDYIDEVQAIDFGTGGTDGNRQASSDTTYTFEPDGAILDGFYAITSFQDTGLATFNTASGAITADALGNPAGNAMIFNADFEPGEFARISVSTVAGSRYATSFFVINTNAANVDIIQPNVTVRIEDSANNVIDTVATGNVSPRGQWFQYFVDVIATDNELTFVFVNNAPGGNGNDLALDQIEAGRIVTGEREFQNGACPGDPAPEPPRGPVCTTAQCNTVVAFPWVLPPCAPECATVTTET